jgi:hypothetical protein
MRPKGWMFIYMRAWEGGRKERSWKKEDEGISFDPFSWQTHGNSH